MCLIIHSPTYHAIHEQRIINSYVRNPHGFGLMYPENGLVRVVKGQMELFDFLDLWDQHKRKNVAIHMRFRTRGEISDANVHPFRVLKKDVHGRDLWMMHNGTIKGIVPPKSKHSDTYHLVKDYLFPLLSKNPDLIDDETFQKMIKKIVGISRLLFMDGDGKVIIINRDKGYTIGQNWLSNVHSIAEPMTRLNGNPPTEKEVKAKEEKVKKTVEFFEQKRSLVKEHNLKYCDETGMYYRIDQSNGEHIYTLDTPETLMMQYIQKEREQKNAESLKKKLKEKILEKRYANKHGYGYHGKIPISRRVPRTSLL